jgi:hypothetical protein
MIMTTTQTASKHGHIRELYYITHIANLDSILKKGIFSHERIIAEKMPYTPIYNKQIIERRKQKKAPNGKSLWSFANLYFNARNPMLFKIRCDRSVDDVAILGISPELLNRQDIFVTTGNAAHSQTEIKSIAEARKSLPRIVSETEIEYWRVTDGTKRKIMAECLVPELVPPEMIRSVYVASHAARAKIEKRLSPPYALSISHNPWMFFRPSRQVLLGKKLALLEGDMFFSRMQTQTISVNVKGIMGKGLASRAKYQYPDVYVQYQDACRNGRLKMGKPYLYKRESSTDLELADEPSTLRKANAETWFLLFATKNHWRDQADIKGIEKGLQWICENYEDEGIKELAVPALGCGLGGLEWKDVGPLLCRYLYTLTIPVSIYLTSEKMIPDEMLSKEFLLSGVDRSLFEK